MNEQSNEYRRRIYDQYATVTGTADGATAPNEYQRLVVERHFPADRGATILEIGCGSGALVRAARAAGYTRVTGVDTSREQVEIATRAGTVGIEVGDAVAALKRHSDGSLDAVVSFDLLEHLKRDEIISLVDEVHRVLASGGRWIIHVPNAESPFFGRIRYGDWTHETAFTRTSLKQLLIASRFESVECHEDRPVVHGVKSFARAGLWRVARAILRAYIAVETGYAADDVVLSQNLLAIAHKGRGR